MVSGTPFYKELKKNMNIISIPSSSMIKVARKTSKMYHERVDDLMEEIKFFNSK